MITNSWEIKCSTLPWYRSGLRLGGIDVFVSSRRDVISMIQECCESAGRSVKLAGGVGTGGNFGDYMA